MNDLLKVRFCYPILDKIISSTVRITDEIKRVKLINEIFELALSFLAKSLFIASPLTFKRSLYVLNWYD